MKKFLKRTAYFFFLIISVLLLLEVCFRYQVIDFYASEWKLLNKNVASKKASKKILIFGDSYSAAPNNTYVNVLRDSFPDYAFYNASIPGTGIRQVALIASKRIKEVQPDEIIYQVYVGNDLSDIQHPTNWSQLNFFRNCYWSLSDQLLFLHYLNYSSGQFASHDKPYLGKADEQFSVTSYNAREKIYIQSDPFFFENAISLNGKDAELFKELMEKTKNVFSDYLAKGKVIFVLIPHSLQVNQTYYDNMKKLGCQFRYSFAAINRHYLFCEKFKTEFSSSVIDPLPFFQEKDSASTFFFANDPHLTDEGQKQLGNFLVKELNARKFKGN